MQMGMHFSHVTFPDGKQELEIIHLDRRLHRWHSARQEFEIIHLERRPHRWLSARNKNRRWYETIPAKTAESASTKVAEGSSSGTTSAPATPPPPYQDSNKKKGKVAASTDKNNITQTNSASNSKKAQIKTTSAGPQQTQKVIENANAKPKAKNSQAGQEAAKKKNNPGVANGGKGANQKGKNKNKATEPDSASNSKKATKAPSGKQQITMTTPENASFHLQEDNSNLATSSVSAASDESNIDEAFAASLARPPPPGFVRPIREPQLWGNAEQLRKYPKDPRNKDSIRRYVSNREDRRTDRKNKEREAIERAAQVTLMKWLVERQAADESVMADWLAEQKGSKSNERQEKSSSSDEVVWEASHDTPWTRPSEWRDSSMPRKSSLSKPAVQQWDNWNSNINPKPKRVSFAAPDSASTDEENTDGGYIPPYRRADPQGSGVITYKPQYAPDNAHRSSYRSRPEPSNVVTPKFKQSSGSQKNKSQTTPAEERYEMSGALDNSNIQPQAKQRKKVYYQLPSVFSEASDTSEKSDDDDDMPNTDMLWRE